jgi:hypothetical protein
VQLAVELVSARHNAYREMLPIIRKRLAKDHVLTLALVDRSEVDLFGVDQKLVLPK